MPRWIEREQDKWLLASLALIVARRRVRLRRGRLVDPTGSWIWFPALVAFPLPPIAIGIAIMRYHLYDIDRIISRTIAYAGLTLVLFAVFTGVNLVLQSIFESLVGGGSVAVAASTLAVAALFNPLRVRVQRVVDRRFNRARQDADETTGSLCAAPPRPARSGHDRHRVDERRRRCRRADDRDASGFAGESSGRDFAEAR